ncbi:hypothetical protein T11_16338 [Trichinella zimbabwensis]|uniref:Uncharacterized protein n=1 Tax=Trichinella zimbabwensis TaxID=268475 RepID=A0A0V1G9V8_9BILA|nr:hypothetical protein T11_16338 [Trichinella zimbabwensis]
MLVLLVIMPVLSLSQQSGQMLGNCSVEHSVSHNS